MSMVSFQVSASKQKLGSRLPLVTGGSWKKSPVTIIWMPPNGLSIFLLRMRPTLLNLSNSSPSTMDTDCQLRTSSAQLTLIDDENLGPRPARSGLAVHLDLAHELVRVF